MFDWWWKLLYNISFWLNNCIDTLYKLFLFFAGAAPSDVNQEIAGSNDANILVRLFTDNRVSVLFLGFLSFAAVIFAISIIIGLVRSEWASKDNGEGKIKVLKHSFKGFLLVFLIPAIFSVGIWATSILLSSIVQGMAGTDPSTYSLAQQLFELCLPDSNLTSIPSWNNSYGTLTSWGWDLTDYNYLIAYVGGFIILFIIGLAALNLIERIIDLVFLYVVSPFIIAVSPLDEGNRLGIWKDLVISKLLSVAGMLICFYIYFLCLPIVKSIFTGDAFIVQFAYLLFVIGGALAARKGGLLISNLVGHNTALIEGQQAGQTAQVVATGFRAGLGVITGLAGGAIHLLGRGAGAITGGISSAAASGTETLATTGAAAVGAAATVANVLQNSANTTFSGIQAANEGISGASPSSSPVSASAPSMPASGSPMSMPAASEPSPQAIIQNNQGIASQAVPDSATVLEAQPAITPGIVQMPVDADIRNAMNGTGFSGSSGGGEGESK